MDVISRLFRGSNGDLSHRHAESQRVPRHSNGLAELARNGRGQESLCVLDLGPTSPQNIAFFTGLGHRTYNEDVLLAARDPSLLAPADDGQQGVDVNRFLAENLCYEKAFFDAVLCWDTPDYLRAELVKPIVARIHTIMKPKGMLLGFFHTRDAGPDAPYQRYHIADRETLELQRIPAPPLSSPAAAAPSRYTHFRLQRIFNNRHIENLFHDFSSIKFFLGRDNIREVLVVR